MAQMPFSPCDASNVADCEDKSFEMLQYIFGDMVTALAQGADPNTVNSASNVLATMFGFFNSGLLIVGALLVTYIAIVGVMNTANDGEAMGKDWSSVWTTARIVTGGAILLPTTSGFSFIQLFVMTVTLWGVGLANGVYRTGMTTSVITPEGVVAGATMPGDFYGMGDFARNYTATSYCKRAANNIFAASDGIPGASVQLDAASMRVETKGGTTETIMPVRDTNPASNLAGGKALCGEVRLATYKAQPAEDESGTVVEALHEKVQGIKVEVARETMADIDAWTATWPATMEQEGWSTVSSNTFNEIVKRADNKIAARIQSDLSDNQTGIDQALNRVLDDMLKYGWASAGGWYQRVGLIREYIKNAVNPAVGSVVGPDLTGLPDDARGEQLIATVNRATDVVMRKADEKAPTEDAKPIDITKSIPSDLSDLDVSKISQQMDTTMDSSVNRFMLTLTTLATGKGGEGIPDIVLEACGLNGQMGGSLNRMKCVGDYMVTFEASVSIARAAIHTLVSAFRGGAAAASAGSVLGTGLRLDGLGVVLRDFIYDGIMEQIAEMQKYLKLLGFYFSVVLPSLPYAIFMVVIVGWLLSVLQAMICAPMWAVLMMTPSRTFIGSQTQGLYLFLTLFLRPALAILGLFAAMLISDPVIDFVAAGFFDYRGAIVGSAGIVGWLAEFFTFMNWFIVFGGILGPVLYMTYGLPQALPDTALGWIGAGISPLGASQAIGEARSSGNSAMQTPSLKSSDGGGSGGNKKALPDGDPNKPRDDGGGGAKQAAFANDQGTAPQIASPSGAAGNNGGGTPSGATPDGSRDMSSAGSSSPEPRFIPAAVTSIPGSARLGNALGSMINSGARGTYGILRGQSVGEAFRGSGDRLGNEFLYGSPVTPMVDNPAYEPPGGEQQSSVASTVAPSAADAEKENLQTSKPSRQII